MGGLPAANCSLGEAIYQPGWRSTLRRPPPQKKLGHHVELGRLQPMLVRSDRLALQSACSLQCAFFLSQKLSFARVISWSSSHDIFGRRICACFDLSRLSPASSSVRLLPPRVSPPTELHWANVGSPLLCHIFQRILLFYRLLAHI